MMRMMGSFFLVLSMVLMVSSDANSSDSRAKEVKLKVGDPAPKFEVKDDQGKVWKTKDHVGKKPVVFFFYPAAFTGG